MKKRKNTFAKIMAFLALISIVIGIVGTGILVIVESNSGSNYEITAEELEQLINSQSGSIDISSSGAVSEDI